MPEKVVVGIVPERRRDSGDAIALGGLLARVAGAELLVVTVFAPPSREADAERAECERAVCRVVEEEFAQRGGAPFTVQAVPGDSPARVMHEMSDRMAPLAVVIASGRAAPEGRAAPGKVGELLLHGGGCPVVIAPRGYGADEPALDVIGVGYDGTRGSEEALRRAVRLAEAAGARLRVLSVFEPFLFRPYAIAQEHESVDVEHALREDTQARLDEALAGLPQELGAEGVLLDGAPVETLARVSREIDLLVLGSRAYGPLRAVLLGPVSRRLVREAACPVMVVPRVPTEQEQVALVGGMDVAEA